MRTTGNIRFLGFGNYTTIMLQDNNLAEIGDTGLSSLLNITFNGYSHQNTSATTTVKTIVVYFAEENRHKEQDKIITELG